MSTDSPATSSEDQLAYAAGVSAKKNNPKASAALLNFLYMDSPPPVRLTTQALFQPALWLCIPCERYFSLQAYIDTVAYPFVYSDLHAGTGAWLRNPVDLGCVVLSLTRCQWK